MAGKVYEGRHNVYWATTVANINAPTVAEITAATDLSDWVTKDGIAPNITGNTVDTGGIKDTFDAQLVGSDGADFQLTLKRGDASGGLTDAAWTLFVAGGSHGFLIVDRDNVGGVLPGVGDKVEVYPAQAHRPAMNNSAANAQQAFVQKFAITRNYNANATVA